MRNLAHITYKTAIIGGLRWSHILVLMGLRLATLLIEGAGLSLLMAVFTMIGTDEIQNREAGTAQNDLIVAVEAVFEYLSISFTYESILIVAVVLVAIRQVVNFIYRMTLVFRQQEFLKNIRISGSKILMTTSIEYFDKHSSGQVVNDLFQEAQTTVSAVFSCVKGGGNLLTISAYVGVVIFSAGIVSLSALVIPLLIVIPVRVIFKRTQDQSSRVAQAQRDFSDALFQRIPAVRLVKLARAEEHETNMIGSAVERVKRSAIELARLQAIIPLIVEPVGAITLAMFFYVAYSVFQLPLAVVLAIVIVLLRLVPVAQELVKMFQIFLSGIGSMRFVVERFETASAATEPAGGETTLHRPLREGVKFVGVRYTYPTGAGRNAALDGLHAMFEAGKMTAIVGPSGAGKSTLIDLFPQLRRPDAGRILIDGTPIEQFSLSSLRTHIAFVPQAPRLIASTIGDHIRFGAPTLDDAAVREAATFAGLSDFIDSLPDGYDTPLGEDGGGLSGGQRQRLDLTRAVAQGSQILILDEPSSNLDPESEEAFRNALESLRRKRAMTLLVIAHRFVSIQRADRILVIEDGRASGYGTHLQLIETNDWYRRAWEASTLEGARNDTIDPATNAAAG